MLHCKVIINQAGQIEGKFDDDKDDRSINKYDSLGQKCYDVVGQIIDA